MKLTALASAVLFSVVCFAASPNDSSDIHLDNGVSVHMAPRSAGSIFSDHAILEEGAARFSNFASYPVQAAQLQIESETPGTDAVVRVADKTIEVASLGGSLKVMDSGMLTRVASGTRMSFQKSGASPAANKSSHETKVWLWVIGGIAAAALAIGLTAAAQGKSPF